MSTLLTLTLGAAELADGHLDEPSGDLRARILGLLESGPEPLTEGDVDGDGLLDAWEDEVAQRFAPVVVLDALDAHRPASVPWLLARARLPGAQGLRAAFAGMTPPTLEGDDAEPFGAEARAGSDEPSDWTCYAHVYPRADGGTLIQYWFYYPYNDGLLFFDHESDWEHVTVRLDARGEPVGVYLARHEDNAPGPFRPWARVRRAGDHPVVLSARGSHATYADAADVPWFESTARCGDLENCAHPRWRTWEGGGLANLGERARPRALSEVMRPFGPWGAKRTLPGTSAPLSPLHQRGWCSDGYQRCLLTEG
ncbi:hypothetical protein [Chondromyces crocatus]|uniref:DUF946 domain-containing protein n=1 Tax=Chondromyces crocatus TaxID=52 RepID=A0A0K1E7F5_CHOCO|nr:hypothetical protein [Chondromyces crocatus]AKT36816.1 uncharacterized protein CMC5_009370 [Chondromyces crocatus]